MATTETIALTDKQMQMIEQIAQERGVTVEEAATQMFREGLEKRVRRGVRRAPAKVYDLPRRTN